MSHRILHCLIIPLLASLLTAGEPLWTTPAGREQVFPPDCYLSASMCAQPTERSQAIPMARDGARSELSHCIRVRVQSQFLDHQSGDQRQYQAWMSSTSRLTGDLVLEGVILRDWLDAKTGLAWAVAAVERQPTADRFRQAATAALAEGTRLLARLEQGDETSRRQAGAEALAAFARATDESALARIILTVPADADLALRVEAGRMQAQMILDRLERTPPVDDRALAGRLADHLGKPLANAVRVADLTSRETNFTSPFGRLMARLLAEELARRQWTVVDTGSAVLIDGALFGLAAAQGQPERLRVMLRARSSETGAILAATEMTVPLALAGGLDIAPQNLAQVLADRRVIAEGEVVGSGLSVAVWTGKGDRDPVFTEGETTRLSVRVNRAAWIRVLYHLAATGSDGKPLRVVLIDNHFIPAEQANRLVELPGVFETAAPFGAEVIQVMASTAQFPPLKTADHMGYSLLIEDLGEALIKTRGLKLAVEERPLVAECRLAITTLAKEWRGR